MGVVGIGGYMPVHKEKAHFICFMLKDAMLLTGFFSAGCNRGFLVEGASGGEGCGRHPR